MKKNERDPDKQSTLQRQMYRKKAKPQKVEESEQPSFQGRHQKKILNSPPISETQHKKPSVQSSAKMRKKSHDKTSYRWLWGVHSVKAALHAGVKVYELYYVAQKSEQFEAFGGQIVSVQQIEQYVPKGAVHQGVVLRTSSGPTILLEDLSPENGTVLVLDQIIDPHNLGALWRSAAAFGVQAIVFPEDRSTVVCGVVSKAASGAVEYVPCARVTNLARALQQLKKQRFFVVGLTELGQELDARTAFLDVGVALVVGSESTGMRPLTQRHCDVLWKLRVSSQFSTLNASVAGAIALSELYAR